MKKVVSVQYYQSPCGKLILGSIEGELCLCDWFDIKHRIRNDDRVKRILDAEYKEGSSAVIRQAIDELEEYFSGQRKRFDVPIRFAGTDFQQCVWNALLEIPYGETRSYMSIAHNVGNPKGVRAVAQAIGSNGISIIVPCHRVVGSGNSLTGFAGGLDAKRYLLRLEGWLK